MNVIDEIIGSKKKKKTADSIAEEIINGSYESIIEKRRKKNEAKNQANIAKSKASTSTKTNSTNTSSNNKRTWFNSGAFSDGYQFGDITKTILGTSTDLKQDATKGVLKIGEGLIDTGAYLLGGGANLIGQDKFANQMKDFVKRDLVEEHGLANKVVNSTPSGMMNNLLNGNIAPLNPFNDDAKKDNTYIEANSLLGDRSDSLVQSGGQLAGTIGLQAVGVPWWVTSGVTSFGGATEEAFNNNATYGEAGTSALISAGAEILTEKLSGGISFGGKTLDKGLKSALTNSISNRTVQTLAKYGFDITGEGIEEVLSEVLSNVGKKLTYEDEKTWQEILASPEALDAYLESFIGGAVLGGGANVAGAIDSFKTGRDYDTGLSVNEEQVVKAEVEARVGEQQKNGKTLTAKEIAKIEEEVIDDIKKGYISTDTIENTLGKKLTTEQEADIEAQLNSLLEQSRTTTDQTAQQQITAQMNELESQLETSRNLDISKDNYLLKSYQEKELRKQNYTYEKTNNAIEDGLKESASKVMNNTARTHEFVDTVVKIAKDTNTKYEFTNTAALKEAGYNIEGKTVNGLVTKDGKVLINIDSSKALNTILGHETTHLLEGTQEYQALQDFTIEYAKSKGIYEETVKRLNNLYKGTNADVNAELTSDLVGDLLFTDQSYIESLSAKQPNVFQRIYNYIKHVYKKATAGSKEAKQLEELKYRFDQAYKKAGKQTSKDTKYSLSDNKGRTLTKEQQEYFKDSKARDENGNLEVVYHGTNKAGFMTFNRNYNFYTSSRDIAESYTRGTETVDTQKDSDNKEYDGGVYEGYVDLKNPLIIDVHGENWSGIPLEYIGIENIEEIFRENGSSYFKEKGKLRASTNDIVEAIAESENFEYDGIIFRNIADRGMYFHKRVDDISSSVYVTFNSNQFKALDNTNPTTNPDIRYSLSEDGKMIDTSTNKEVKLEAAEAGTHGTLMAIHNLTANKLKGVIELGGFPVPSIAITNPSIINHGGFGDISVIFDKDTINPADYRNEVYDRDVWSPRFPQVNYDINNESIKKYIGDMYNYNYVNKDSIIDQAVLKYMYQENLSQMVNSEGKDKVLERIKTSPEMQYLWKTQVEKGQYSPKMQDLKYNDYYSNEALQNFIDNFEGDMSLEDFYYHYMNYRDMQLSEEQNKNLKEQVLKAITPEVEQENNNILKDKQLDSETKEKYRKELFKADTSWIYNNYFRLQNFIGNAVGLQKNGNRQVIDVESTLNDISNQINQNEYEQWVDNTYGKMFENTKKGIRNDKDVFTPSGNRRSFDKLHDEYNLRNIVDYITKKDTKGSEGGFMAGGFGKIQAKRGNKFDSIQDIKNSESKIVDEQMAHETLEPLKTAIHDDIQELSNYYNTSGYSYGSWDSAANAISEFAGKKNLTEASLKRVLKSYYNFDVDNIPKELLQKVIKDLKALDNIQTDYFEAKPQRAVGLDEVQAIVVPNNMSSELKQELKNRNMRVVEYDPNIEGDRQAKINEFDDLKFSLSNPNEEIAPTGNWNVRGEDVKLQIEEAIAPLQEAIANLTEQVREQVKEQVSEQVQAPIAPKTVVNEKGVQISVGDVIKTFNNSIYEVTDITTDNGITRASLKNDSYKTAIGINAIQENLTNPALNHVSTQTENDYLQDAAPVEKQGRQDFENITDEQAPNFEDVAADAMIEGGHESYNESKVPSPLDSRDIDEVGNRKVKAYQYENPEVKPFFQAEAQNMLYDLDNTIKGEKGVAIDELGNYEYYGITRQTTEAIAYLKDNHGYSYDQIRQGLNKIIEDDGKENNAVSKRIEFMLDERLREGYTTSDGIPIPANEDYINFLNEKQITEYNKEAFNALTDDNVPPEQTTMAVEPKRNPSKQLIPAAEKVPQNGNTDVEKAKQRSWAETSTESDTIKGKILLSDLDAEKIQYVPITNKETLSKANAKLDSLGYDKALEQFYSIIKSGEIPKLVDITMGQRLMQEALAKGDKATAIEILQDISILGTEVGRIEQSLSIIQRMTPAGQLRMLDKIVQRGKLRGEESFKGLELTEDMKNRIMDCYNEDGVTYDQDKLNEVMEQIKQEIADQMPVTKMDKINAWRYFSMLGNPKTHARNIISTAANYATIEVKNVLARTMEEAAPVLGFNIDRTKTWKQSSQEVKDFAEKTTLEMKDIISGENQLGIKSELKAKRKIFKTEFWNKLFGGNSDLMTKEDSWFSRPTFKRSLQEFLTANGIETQQDIQNNPKLVEKGKQYALEQSQIATFRQRSWLASKISEIERKNTFTQIAVGSVLPFKKTPINIAKTGISYSPIGYLKSLTYDLYQVRAGKMDASQAIDNIAQAATGTALTLIGYMLAQMGFLNGAGDDDKEGKYDYQLGKQGYSINIGDNTYSLSWLSPLAMPLLVGANFYEQLIEKEEWNPDVVIETLGQTLDPLSEMSFLSSFTDVLSSYEQGDMRKLFSMFEAAGKNYVTQFIPTASSQLAATLDDTKRSTKVSGDSTFKVGEELYNQIIYKIPILRQTLEPTLDIWGNEVKQNENLFTRAFENFIAPYARKDSIATEIDEELKDLFSQTGDNGILPSIPYNYVNYDGEKYNMSAEEYTDYKKMYGQTANDLLEDLFRTTAYKNATSEEKVDMVNDVYDYARDEAKLDYLAKEGVDYTNATEDKVEVYKENLIKGAIENNMTTKEYGLYLEDPEEYKFLMEKDYEYRQQYFDTYDSLKELDKSFEDQKEGINDDDELDALYSEKKAGIVDKIINSGLDDTEKASLYKRYYNSDTVDTIVKSAISIDDYLIYETKEFKADKNEKGNSIPGSRKDKVINYVNTLDLDIPQKAILIKSTNTFKFNDYNSQIVKYVGSLDIDYEDMVSILEDLDMTVKDNMVYWD